MTVWSYLQRKLGIAEMIANQRSMMSQNEEIQTEVDELNTAFGVIANEFTGLGAALAVAQNRVAELEAAGVAPQTVDQLRKAVDNVQEFANRIVKAVDPAQPTPTDASPAPVTDVATDPAATDVIDPTRPAGETDPVRTDFPEPEAPGPSLEELSPGTTDADEGDKPSL